MKVIHINTKSKSPKNDINNINRLLMSKSKNSSKNTKMTKTRNLDFSSNNTKKKDIFKRIFPHNNYIHFSSNNCTSTNTTNYNNSKTNNFIFFENDLNFKDAEKLKQQINSLIKHNSSNNCSNVKFINNINYRRDKDKKKRKDLLSHNLKIHSKEDSNIDIFGNNNKNDRLYINTNYSILLNNTKKEKEKKKICTKIQNYKNCINFYNSRPLTLNFSNEINNFNSYKMLLNNKSMKYLNKYKPNYRKKSGTNENTSKIKRKGNSENKDNKKRDLLMDNKRINGSKSYNILFINKNKLSKSTSFSPIHDINNKKKDYNKKNRGNLKQLKNNRSSLGKKNTSVEKVQINLYSKNKNNNSNIKNRVNARKINSMKNSDNQINLQFFNKIDNKNRRVIKNTNKARGVINSQKTSPFYSKKLNKNKVDAKNKNYFNINVDFDATNEKNSNNNTFVKNNKKTIITPEQNHFLAIKQIQQIKNNNNIFK